MRDSKNLLLRVNWFKNVKQKLCDFNGFFLKIIKNTF